MKALVLINNNLKYDTRVKRHISALAEVADSVHVIARPIPDYSWGMPSRENVTYNFLEYKATSYPSNRIILEYCKKWKLDKIIIKSFPLIACDDYYSERNIEKYTQKLYRKVRGERWNDITGRKAEEMPDDVAVSYPLMLLDCSVQMAKMVEEVDADVVLCNDIDTLFAGVVHKRRFNSRLLYDFHDIAADISENVFPQMYSNMLILFENELIKSADAVFSISKANLEWSKKVYRYKAAALPIINCSRVPCVQCIKEKPEKIIRIYYHGMSDESRGLWELIHVIEKREEFSCVLRCLPSENLEKIKQYVINKNIEDKVCFLDPVDADLIPTMAQRDGDIGFHFCDTANCLNWRNALTNKFIEYTKAGIPIICSATLEQAHIINQYENGWLLESNDEQGINKAFDSVLHDIGKYADMAMNSQRAAKEEFEWEKYKRMLQLCVLGKMGEI